MKKRLLFGAVLLASAALLLSTLTARAASPILQLSATGTGDYVEVTVNGATANSSVLLNYQASDGTSHLQYLGTTDANGSYNSTISTATYNISPNATVYVTVNNQSSNSLSWPYDTTSSGALALSQTSVVMQVGQSTTMIAQNLESNKLYLLNNSNPQVANININGSQIQILANSYGQTVATLCVLGTTSNCASTYITVQNSGATALTFSQSNLTIASGQSSTVSILNGISGQTYAIMNNSNPSVISGTISSSNVTNQTVTLNAVGNNGSASLTVCSNDMSSCGIINATVGSVSSSALNFSQTNPTLTIGQTLNITLSGGTSYNISANSNSSIVQASITNTNNLTLVGNSAGSATVTVCSSAGNCGAITAVVSYATTGPITLSQNNLWLQVGQAVSIVVSGGTMPYSLSTIGTNTGIFKPSLNNNILTITGISAGSSKVSVCSSGGACVQLSVLVNGVSSSKQLTFSNNNLNLTVGQTATVNMYGAGGYYISKTNGQNIASIAVSGSSLNISALTAGSANATVCQSSGQCSVIYVAVTSTKSNTPISFSASNLSLSVGQNMSISLSGGSGSSYYVSSNSNPTVVRVNINGSNLNLSGLNNGSAVLSVCSTSNNCNSLAVTVNNTSTSSESSSYGQTPASGNQLLSNIAAESQILASGNLASILANSEAKQNISQQQVYLTRYVSPLLKGFNLTQTQINILDYFITYGTASSLKLGAGERAGVVSSYLQAYGQLPTTAAAWSDVLKIGNGRWPGAANDQAIVQAKSEFVKVYNRQANMSNAHDANAITIIAYGLRPTHRNTNSEKQAIRTFESVYLHAPVNALAWNIVRAIAYSGATR